MWWTMPRVLPRVIAVCVLGALLLEGAPVHGGGSGLSGAPSLGAVPAGAPHPAGEASIGASPRYAVNFTEAGLADWRPWTVTLGGTSDGIVGVVPLKASPSGVVYDYLNGQVYVAVPSADTVTVVNATNNTTVGGISVGTGPSALALDPDTGYLYVSNTLSDNVTVIDGWADDVVTSIPVGVRPDAVAVDPLNDTVYVANAGNGGRGNLTLINGTTLMTVGSIRVGVDPRGVTYDPLNTLLYVANGGSGDLTIINTTTNTSIGSIALGKGIDPVAPAVDTATGLLYLSNSASSGGELVVDPATRTVTTTIPVAPYAGPAAYDPLNDYVYAGEEFSGVVAVVDAASQSVVGTFPVPTGGGAIAFDNSSGELYVASTFSPVVTAVNGSYVDGGAAFPVPPTTVVNTTVNGSGMITFHESSGTYTFSASSTAPYFVFPETGTINVTQANISVNLTFEPERNLTFTATGLPGAETWSVALRQVVSDGVLGTVWVGSDPSALMYDALNGWAYVANSGSNSVSVVNDSSDALVGFISVGTEPSAVAVDPLDGYVFVANSGSANVSVINSSLDGVIRSLPVGEDPTSLAFDPANDVVYVANAGNGSDLGVPGNLTVVDAATLTTVGAIPVGVDPVGVTYDPANDLLYVSNAGSANLTIVQARSNRVVGSIGFSEGVEPSAPAIDPANGNLYVAVGGATASVYVMNPTNGEILAEIPVAGGPGPAAFDPANGDVYVGSTLAGNVSVISASAGRVVGSVPTEPGAGAISVDAASDVVLVADPGTGEVILVNGSAWDGGIANWSAPVFQDDTTAGGSGTIRYIEVDGNYSFSVYPPFGYTATPASGTLALNASGASVPIAFSPLPYSLLTFVERGGLAGGASWRVIVNGAVQTTGGTTIQFREPAGTYAYTVIGPSGRRVTGIPATGSVVLNGIAESGPTESFSFLKAPTYRVTIEASGLPTGASWCVVVALLLCSTQATHYLGNLSPGEYAYAISAPPNYRVAATEGGTDIPLAGEFEILSRSITVKLRFEYPYAVTFTETGLTTGTWSITIKGVTRSNASGEPIVFDLTNGTYRYRVGTEPGYQEKGAPTVARVAGSPVAVAVTFTSKS